MSVDLYQKINESHLKRDAFLYVRQSSLRQVFENTESTKRQYALRERGIALGWPIERIHVIDDDLGKSGAHSTNRSGFQRLVTEVALGNAGIILGLEVSRLARNSTDWHRLIELAALAGTLILDEDGIYDPSHFNDRMLLGLKGTMSEAELHVLKARLQGGIRNKARRGELEIPLPIGFIYHENGNVVLDPDQRIQDSIQLIFDSFAQLGSAMAIVNKFSKESLLFPRRIRRGIGKGDVVWGPLEHSRTIQILHNPRYAGAFVYGRTRTGRTTDLRPTTLKVKRENWQVLIQQAHVGYISWDVFERNQIKLSNNALGFSALRGSVAQKGPALLQGRIICGICGERIRVRYNVVGEDRAEPYYTCTEASVRKAGKVCQSVRGVSIDAAISTLVQETLSPAAVHVAFAVQQEIKQRIEQTKALRQKHFEHVQYEAELARRRYLKVDPDNRLVADTLEADWNEKLRIVHQVQQEHDQQRKTDQQTDLCNDPDHLMSVVNDFTCVWNNPDVPALERKRIIAYLIEDVTLIKNDQIELHVRFRGGKTQHLMIPRPVPMALVRKTKPEVIKALEHLLDTCNDRQAALKLNEMGYTNWRNESFTFKKVRHLRREYNLKSRFERLREQGFLTAYEMAQKLGVSAATVHTYGREGLIKKQLYGNDKWSLYEAFPDDTIFQKGEPGRRRSKPAQFITVQPTTQDAI